LPKGKSAFAAPKSDDVFGMLRRAAGGVTEDTPGWQGAWDTSRLIKKWTPSSQPFAVHDSLIESAWARDVKVGNRHVLVVVDSEIAMANWDARGFDGEPLPRENPNHPMSEYLKYVSGVLAPWRNSADGAPFPEALVITTKRCPADAEFQAIVGDPNFRSDATYGRIEGDIVFWNFSPGYGTDIDWNSHLAFGHSYGAVNPAILDHEIGHAIGREAGPPTPHKWVGAMFQDDEHGNEVGYGIWRQASDNFVYSPEVRHQAGITDYAARYMAETMDPAEDWAESVRLYMAEKRSRKAAFLFQKAMPDGSIKEIPVKFSDWAPYRYYLLKQYMDTVTM
jgi:hypothetical protein